MKGVSTSTYLAILDAQGDLHSAIADMKVLHHIPVPCESVLNQARFLVIDANPPIEKMLEAAMRAVRLGVSVFFEPTSEPKANKAFKCNEFVSCLTYASPNAKELIAMANADDKDVMYKNEGQSGSLIILRDAATRVLKRMMPEAYLIITLGENGVLFATKSKDDIQCFHFPAEQVNVKNTTGGGDSLAGAYLKAVLDGKSHREAIEYGQIVAVQSIAYEKAAISPYIRLKS
jgi:sugar/nucleoside kinase (ribokinase family)